MLGVSERALLPAGENPYGSDRLDRFVEFVELPERICAGDWVNTWGDVPLAAENGCPWFRTAGEAEVRAVVADVGDWDSGGRRLLGGGTISWESRGRDLWLEDELSLDGTRSDAVDGCVNVLSKTRFISTRATRVIGERATHSWTRDSPTPSTPVPPDSWLYSLPGLDTVPGVAGRSL